MIIIKWGLRYHLIDYHIVNIVAGFVIRQFRPSISQYGYSDDNRNIVLLMLWPELYCIAITVMLKKDMKQLGPIVIC